MMVKLAIGAIFKQETPYLKEWIEYHKLVGVEKFYLYDNDETVRLEVTDLLQSHIEEGVVIYKHWPGGCEQFAVYNDIIRVTRTKVEWVAFIDLDEFLYPLEGSSVPEILNQFTEPIYSRGGKPTRIGGISVNTVYFGSSGHPTKPEQLQIEAYTKRTPDDYPGNVHIKSIVRPECVFRFQNPHYATYRKKVRIARRSVVPVCCVNMAKKIVPQEKSQLNSCFCFLRLNHYITRSREEFLQKVEKGTPDVQGIDSSRIDIWNDVESATTVHDEGMMKFALKVRERC